MVEIRVLGSGCANCQRLEQLVFNVCAENDLNTDIQKITDHNDFSTYGVKATPALVVNGKVLSQGTIPSISVLEQWLKKAASENRSI